MRHPNNSIPLHPASPRVFIPSLEFQIPNPQTPCRAPIPTGYALEEGCVRGTLEGPRSSLAYPPGPTQPRDVIAASVSAPSPKRCTAPLGRPLAAGTCCVHAYAACTVSEIGIRQRALRSIDLDSFTVRTDVLYCTVVRIIGGGFAGDRGFTLVRSKVEGRG